MVIAPMLKALFLFCLMHPVRAESISAAYPPPEGSIRQPSDRYGEWLNSLPLKAKSEPIRTYDGRIVHHNGRPIDMPLVRGDLQQCADSAIRLRATWLRESGAPNTSLNFRATSGDPLPWEKYRSGWKPYVKNERIAWKKTDPSKQTWDGWLRAVFNWAGTRSLVAYETYRVKEPRTGDMLVEGGSPGHAVVILDIAKKGDRTWFLLGEGFMPAQDFHIEHGPHAGWWEWTSKGIRLPHWHMKANSLRRWNENPK